METFTSTGLENINNLNRKRLEMGYHRVLPDVTRRGREDSNPLTSARHLKGVHVCSTIVAAR